MKIDFMCQYLLFLFSLACSLIYERFAGTDPNSKDNSVGLQLLGIVLANNMPPYDAECSISEDR